MICRLYPELGTACIDEPFLLVRECEHGHEMEKTSCNRRSLSCVDHETLHFALT